MTEDALEDLIQRLPELLKKRPELAEKLYEVIKDRFVTNEALKEYMIRSDRRFEELLAEMNRRFEAIDKRFEELLTEMNRRFEAADKRFEAIDKRFEAIDKRFEELLTEMNRRFEAADKRFEELLTEMNRRFEAADKRFEVLHQELLETKAAVGALGQRSGIALEQTILRIFHRALELRGIDVDKVEKIGLRDEQGELYSPGAKVEYDLYVHNSEHFLFEIKYRVTEEDLEVFLAKAKFFEKQRKVHTKKAVIALEIDEYVKRICDDRGIEIITK